MMKTNRPSLYILLIASLLLLQSRHEEWLDEKRDKKQVVPETLQDLQALLDNTTVMNDYVTPCLGELGADDYVLDYSQWVSISYPEIKNAMVWAADLYEGETSYSWILPYQQVFYANLALEGTTKLEPAAKEQEVWNNKKGSALFFRAWAFYQAAQLFCQPYDAATADTGLGIPLRLESDIHVKSVRSTVEQTYQQIITDLQQAVTLLPDTPEIKTRPSKPAAHALLARAFLLIGDYRQALENAQACLALHDQLLDYNAVDGAPDYPFAMFNAEVIFHNAMEAYPVFAQLEPVPELYNSYHESDLRKTLCFGLVNSHLSFTGSYNKNQFPFTGLATDEIYLIGAECQARLGNNEAALQYLNTLLEKRYFQGTFVPYAVSTVPDVLGLVLEERRKELVMRGLRWSDLRRLNREERFAKTLVRTMGEETYTLLPGSPRYTLPIPDEVIEKSGMEQNGR